MHNVDELYAMLLALTTKVDGLIAEVKELNGLVNPLTHSMPTLPDGDKPDYYGHRRDHDELRDAKEAITKVRSAFWESVMDRAATFVVVALAYLVVSEEGRKMLQSMFKFFLG